ncbi:MAG: dephospho-CoA kinase [Firmicutes bacterium]|nr:dephospho-CoA kinase [Bacillota bacterium]
MLVVGLTGGIASGKSTVAKMFVEKGYRVLDSDVFARDVVQPGTEGWQEIRAAFGDECLLADGSLNRTLLADIIFNDANARAKLNNIVHPKVLALIDQGIHEARLQGEPLVVVDVPLLYEIGFEDEVDVVVVVSVKSQLQMERLQARDGLTLEEAQSRIDAQMPLSVKASRADFVIDNSGSLENTQMQVNRLVDKLLEESEG